MDHPLGALRALCLTLLPLGACAEEEQERLPTRVATEVELSRQEPGSACVLLGVLETRVAEEWPTPEAPLRRFARSRGANYVALDFFREWSEATVSATPLILRARLFSCQLWTGPPD